MMQLWSSHVDISGRLDQIRNCLTGGYLDREISQPLITLGTPMAVCFPALLRL